MLDKKLVKKLDRYLGHLPEGYVISLDGNAYIKVKEGEYKECLGGALPKDLYPDLYKALEGNYGETEKEFNLPDLKERFIK